MHLETSPKAIGVEMKKLYSVEREYPVAVSALWDAWMNADALASWYSPTDLKVVDGSVTSIDCAGGVSRASTASLMVEISLLSSYIIFLLVG